MGAHHESVSHVQKIRVPHAKRAGTQFSQDGQDPLEA